MTTLSLVFNDLSVGDKQYAPDKATARIWMQQFVQVLTAAVDQKINTLRTHAGFEEILLTPDYPMSAWFNDHEVDRTAREFILFYSQQHPVIKPYSSDLKEDDPLLKRRDAMIGCYNNEDALGLTFAYLFNGIALSIPAQPCWNTAHLQLDYVEEDATTGDLIDNTVQVPHITSTTHLSEHESWIAVHPSRQIKHGRDLVKKWDVLFPNLILLESARRQLERINPGDHLSRAWKQFATLNDFSAAWQLDTPFVPASYMSPESNATMEQHGETRRFQYPSHNIDDYFTWHVRLDSDWRIHFLPHVPTRKIYIGYVGKHLPTATVFS